MESRKTSFVYDYLDESANGVLSCKLCGKIVTNQATGKTVTARCHLRDKHGIRISLMDDGALEFETEEDKELSATIQHELPPSMEAEAAKQPPREKTVFDFVNADAYRKYKWSKFEEWEKSERERVRKLVEQVKEEATKKCELARAQYGKKKAEERLRNLEKLLRELCAEDPTPKLEPTPADNAAPKRVKEELVEDDDCIIIE
ncbi:hypothetical protein AAVH_12927 [Aphelenchoides avenae]|nr:hypothetical protein AAVH_12927 [Aphelenchus avenae]